MEIAIYLNRTSILLSVATIPALSVVASIPKRLGLAADICYGYADNSRLATWKQFTNGGNSTRSLK
jgi:hypothetical protein